MRSHDSSGGRDALNCAELAANAQRAASDRIIVRSAIEGNGRFRAGADLALLTTTDSQSLLPVISDGDWLFPLAVASRPAIEARGSCRGPLGRVAIGRSSAVSRLEQVLRSRTSAPWLALPKVFMECRGPAPPASPLPAGYEIRFARGAELAEVASLRWKLAVEEASEAPQAGPPSPSAIDPALPAPLVLLHHGALLGTIGSDLWSSGAGMLNSLYISPGFRGRGLGRSLFCQGVRGVLSRSKTACLFVSTDNRIARHVYERCGFTVTDSWRMLILSERASGDLAGASWSPW